MSSDFVCLSSPGQFCISCLGDVRAIKLITCSDQAKVKATTAEEETTFCSVALVVADLPCSFRLLQYREEDKNRGEETDDQLV